MTASAPIRNAVSVEITTPHACAASLPVHGLNSRKMPAGIVETGNGGDHRHHRP